MKIDLRVSDLRKVELGTIVITSKGFEFTLVSRDVDWKETWRDETSKLLWLPLEKERLNWSQAMEKFNSPEKRLPTKEEFEEAETHGFREVLPNMSAWFWSASLCPIYAGLAYGFDGDVGGTDFGYRDFDYVSVRCVGR